MCDLNDMIKKKAEFKTFYYRPYDERWVYAFNERLC